MVKSVDTADLKSAASFIAGVPVRFRSRAPRGHGFKRIFELNRYAFGEIDEARKRVGSIPVLGTKTVNVHLAFANAGQQLF